MEGWADDSGQGCTIMAPRLTRVAVPSTGQLRSPGPDSGFTRYECAESHLSGATAFWFTIPGPRGMFAIAGSGKRESLERVRQSRTPGNPGIGALSRIV